MYSIRELADMAGVSTRTLRYYDQIGLLKPAFISDAGYRFYGKQEVDMLQQILFYRERGFDLKSIRRILMEEDFDLMGVLEEHLRELKTQRAHMDALISPESKEAGRIVLLHKEWLGMTWKKYTEEAHKAVAEMYISDERFQAYYDREVPGCAGFLETAIKYKIGE